MEIAYRLNHAVSVKDFIDLLKRSSLSERRPIDNLECMQGMLDNANLSYTAWLDDQLVGIARCVTDFHYCCYLSDLAVDAKLQHSGIGKKLISLCAEKTEKTCKLVLLASPAANGYYPKIGMNHMDRCWTLDPDQALT